MYHSIKKSHLENYKIINSTLDALSDIRVVTSKHCNPPTMNNLSLNITGNRLFATASRYLNSCLA